MSPISNKSLRSPVDMVADLSSEAGEAHCRRDQGRGKVNLLSWLGWYRSGPKGTAGRRLAPISGPFAPSKTAERTVTKSAAVHFHNGETLVFTVDRENEAYLYSCLHGSADSARIAWFETVGGCLVGLNLTQVDAVFWYDAGPTAPATAEWDPMRLVVHFADKEEITLHQITGAAIDKLRGATLSKHRATAFCTLRGRDDAPVSISIDNTTYMTMPAEWLSEDRPE
jgi:hypothetical protein